jgi:hypothetical protein
MSEEPRTNEAEERARQFEAEIRSSSRPCGSCNAETVTERQGAVVMVRILHDNWCPWLRDQ